ncbi:hypothetical protein ACFQ0K_04675 [Nocardioides caeni]|uniref:Uncharacterized protein n=1 Tax=Nocardioides caeni TaxID=574700 RepID=A0A4S8N5A6_9ACTN|nr:hypothetical protein [Nocardioides caeni]THV10802.1 hypothetical protein E9934_13805 [Nocardioides caeni]
MLPRRSPLRSARLLVATTAIGGLAIAGLSPAAPAQAADPIVDGYLGLSSSINYNETDCAGASEPANIEAAFTAGTTVKRTLSFDQTATATGDETDTLRLRGSQTLGVSSSVAGGQLSALTATSTVTGSVTAAKAESACSQSGFPAGSNSQGGIGAQINRTTDGWLRVQATSSGVGGQIMTIAFGQGQLVDTELGGFAVRDLSYDHWIYVPAGEYYFEVSMGGAAVDGYDLEKIALKQSVKLTFHRAGIARSAATGTARPQVTLPSYLTCSTGRATVGLTSKIRGASRVTLYVNGVRKSVINRPTPRRVTLKGVPTNRAVTLRAVVQDGRRSTAVTRSYRSC